MSDSPSQRFVFATRDCPPSSSFRRKLNISLAGWSRSCRAAVPTGDTLLRLGSIWLADSCKPRDVVAVAKPRNLQHGAERSKRVAEDSHVFPKSVSGDGRPFPLVYRSGLDEVGFDYLFGFDSGSRVNSMTWRGACALLQRHPRPKRRCLPVQEQPNIPRCQCPTRCRHQQQPGQPW